MTKDPAVMAREAGTSSPDRRPSRRRLSVSHVLIVVVVGLAFTLNLLALQDRTATTMVAIADDPILAGSPLEVESLRMVSIASDFDGLASLLTAEDVSAFEGWIVQRSLPAGALVDEWLLAEPGAASGLRSMSVPVDVEHAAGGSIAAGDRVDVISVIDGNARYVATALEVVAVSDREGGALGNLVAHHLVVGVTADEALRLAQAIDAGSLEVVRATGAAEVTLGDVANDS